MGALPVQHLIDQYFGGNPTTDEVRQLNEILVESDEARGEFWHLAEQHYQIWTAVNTLPASDLSDNPSTTAASTASSRGLSAGFGGHVADTIQHSMPLTLLAALVITGASAVGLLGWLSIGLWQMASVSTKAKAPAVMRPEIVARVIQCVDCEWEPTSQAVAPGMSLRAGRRLELASGFIECQYQNGTRIILEGPTEFQFLSPLACRLSLGKLTARVNAKGTGFTVETPLATVVDLGTEFGVQVASSQAINLLVYEGQVQLARVDGAANEPLRWVRYEAGQGARLTKNSKIVHSAGISDKHFTRTLAQSKQSTVAEIVAYHNLPGAPGGQAEFSGSYGMDFRVNRPIEVTRLGVFDSDQDGLKQTITAELWSRDDRGTINVPEDDRGQEKIVSLRFTPEEPGTLVASSRFLPLSEPLRLEPGAYTIVAHGYGRGEHAGNYTRPPKQFRRLNDGGQAISFVGRSRYGNPAGQFPLVTVPHTPVNQFSAGTFAFQVVEPDKAIVPAPERSTEKTEIDLLP